MSNGEKNIVLLAFLCSLLLHLLSIIFPFPAEKLPLFSENQKQNALKVKIKYQDNPSKKDAVKPLTPSPPKIAKEKTKSSLSSRSIPVTSTPSYKDFMPNSIGSDPFQKVALDDSRYSEPYAGNERAQILTEVSDFGFHFDLPLVWRREISEGSVKALLEMDSDKQITLLSLTGSPAIRAALAETLCSKESLPSLRNVFHFFKASKFQIVVKYLLNRAKASGTEFVTDYQVFNNRVLITMTRYAQFPSFQGSSGGVSIMTFDQEDAGKKAKIKDRFHLNRLSESLAYRQNLKNIQLSSSGCL